MVGWQGVRRRGTPLVMKSWLTSLFALTQRATVEIGPSLAATAEDRVVSKAEHVQAKKKRSVRQQSTRPDAVIAPDQRASQRAVCQSQCNLERMSCDQGRGSAFRDRADQLQAANSSCYLAVQGCLNRC